VTTTRAAVLRRAIELTSQGGHSRGFATRDGVNALTSTGGAALTLIDTAGLPPTGAAATTAKGWWIWLPLMTAANQRKLISSYSGALNTLTHQGPNYDATTITALGVGTPYRVVRDDPDRWTMAFNEALRTILSQINYDEITITTSGQVLYTLSAAPFTLTGIVRDSQIMDVEYVDAGATAGEERWLPWSNGFQTWRTYMDGQNVIIDFQGTENAPTTAVRLRVKWSSQFAAVTSDATVLDVDEYWAALATLTVMADWLADPDNPSDDWNMIGRKVRTQYAAQRRLILGEDAYRQVQRTAQTVGYLPVHGRAGRRR
jgi:hypothetical protein